MEETKTPITWTDLSYFIEAQLQAEYYEDLVEIAESEAMEELVQECFSPI